MESASIVVFIRPDTHGLELRVTQDTDPASVVQQLGVDAAGVIRLSQTLLFLLQNLGPTPSREDVDSRLKQPSVRRFKDILTTLYSTKGLESLGLNPGEWEDIGHKWVCDNLLMSIDRLKALNGIGDIGLENDAAYLFRNSDGTLILLELNHIQLLSTLKGVTLIPPKTLELTVEARDCINHMLDSQVGEELNGLLERFPNAAQVILDKMQEKSKGGEAIKARWLLALPAKLDLGIQILKSF